MRRIKLGKPYEDFLDEMVASGYYATATEVIRAILREKMEERKGETFTSLLLAGQREVDKGNVIDVDEDYMDKKRKEAIAASNDNMPIPDYLRP